MNKTIKLYHITPLDEDYIRKYGLKPMLDTHIGAKEMKIGKVINLAQKKDIYHLLWRFTMLPSKFTEDEPNIIEVIVPKSDVKKVHHARYNFSWFVTKKRISPKQITRIISAGEWSKYERS